MTTRGGERDEGRIESSRLGLVCPGSARHLDRAAPGSTGTTTTRWAGIWGYRYQDVLAIEKNPEDFSSRKAPRPHGQALPMMISMDDPAHQQRRSLVNRGFTPKRVGDQEPKLREFCRTILNEVCEGGECDFVWEVSARPPLMVIADMLGLSDMQEERPLHWSEALMRPAPAEPLAAGQNAIQEFRESQLQVIADRRRNPRDDLMTTLCEAEIGGQRLDDESIVHETLLTTGGDDDQACDQRRDAGPLESLDRCTIPHVWQT